jgi:hypothetical protein
MLGVTKSHGAIVLPTIQSMDITPKAETKAIEQFGSQEAALFYTVMSPGSAKVAFEHTNQRLIDDLVMDQDPNSTQSYVSEQLYQPFHLVQNFLGQDGKIKGSQLLYGCNLDASLSENQKLKEAAAGTLSIMFQNRLRFRGLGLQYIRCTNGVGPIAQPSAVTLATSTSGGHLAGGEYYVRVTPVATLPAGAEGVGSIESPIAVPTGTSTNDITVTTSAPAGNITSYNIYVGTTPGGERYSGNDGGTGTYIITQVPPYTASPCPNVDGGTGAYIAGAPNGFADFVFSSNSVTLSPAAAEIPPTVGAQYALVAKNGLIQASATLAGLTGNFSINISGTAFGLNAAASNADWWDVIYPFKP